MAKTDYTPRLQDVYEADVRKALKEKFGYANDMQIPKLEKIVINMGAVSYTHLTLPTICSV